MRGEGGWPSARKAWTAIGLASPLLLLTIANFIYRQHESRAMAWEPAMVGAVGLFLVAVTGAGFALACREFYRNSSWSGTARLAALVGLCMGFTAFSFLAGYVFARTSLQAQATLQRAVAP